MKTRRTLLASVSVFAIIAMSAVLVGCPEEKKGPVGSASAATTAAGSAAPAASSAKPAGSGW